MIEPPAADDQSTASEPLAASASTRARDRYQFGILPLLALTTLIAAACAWLRVADLPRSFQIGLGIYAVAMSVYLTMRVPYALRLLRGKSVRWKKIQADRREMEQLIQRHQQHRADNQDASPPSTP
ncbi:MAG: hypothetical protein J5I93_22215 [Pirellulaceae bacterium]|nr:hypothetical protein [Pirellulaceae bacterium]